MRTIYNSNSFFLKLHFVSLNIPISPTTCDIYLVNCTTYRVQNKNNQQIKKDSCGQLSKDTCGLNVRSLINNYT